MDSPLPRLSLHSIRSLLDDHLFAWLDLYETSFPQIERVPISVILRGIRQIELGMPGKYECLAALDGSGRLVGIAQWGWHAEFSTAYLGYFAVDPSLRSKGLGSQFYRLLYEWMKTRGAALVAFDVERPELQPSSEAQALAERRIRFYQRLGVGLLNGMHFFYGDPPIRQLVMVHPIEEQTMREILPRVRGTVNSFGGWLEEASPNASVRLDFLPVDELVKNHHNST